MLKKNILAALVVASAVFAENQAQNNVLANMKFGAHAAFNYGTVWGENTDKLKFGWGAGFTGGLDLKFAISPKVFFLTGLEYEYRSIDWDVKDFFESMISSGEIYLDREEKEMLAGMDCVFSLGYLQIPLVVRFNVNPQFFVDAGIRLGFILSSEMEVSLMGMSNSVDVPGQMEKDFDLGIVAGFGYTVMSKFDLYFRYTMGFTDMIDIVKFADFSGEDVDYRDAPAIEFKNMRFLFGVTYWFN